MRTYGRRTLASLVMAQPRKPSSEAQLNNDVAILEQFYHNEGFHSVDVEREVTPGRRRPVVTFRIVEGPRTRVSAIAISGNVTVGTDRLLGQLSVRPGRFFSQAELNQSGQALQTYYLNSGYPFVQVQTGMAGNDTLATVTFDISEGRLCHVSDVRVRGNKTVSTRTILRASEVKPGERFSQEHLRGAQRRLYATKLFSRVTYYVIADSGQGAEGAGPGTDSVVVRFDVVEQSHQGVALGGGAEYPPTRLIVSAEWEHDDILNRGHTLLVSGEAGPTLFPFGYFRAALDATYRVPYLILTRIDFQTHPYISYERTAPVFDTAGVVIDSSATLREIGIETGMSRSIFSQLTVGLTNRLRLVADTANGITNSLVLTGRYDNRDNIFDPGRGLSIQTAVEGAGGPLRGDNDLYKLTGDVRVYRRLGIIPPRQEQLIGDFVVAVRAMAGIVRPYGRSDAVPYYEAFTLGGGNSMRGYGDRSIGPESTSVAGYRFGPTVVNGNFELRTPHILRWVGLVGFLDVGDVGWDFRMRAYEYGAGAGIRVKTPVGPVRLDWGKQLRNPPAKDIGRFYVGLLHAF